MPIKKFNALSVEEKTIHLSKNDLSLPITSTSQNQKRIYSKMKWQGRQQSTNVDDRRKSRNRKVGAGIGAGTIVFALLALFMGQDPAQVLQQVVQQAAPQNTSPATNTSPEEEALAQFVKVVLKDTEDVWSKIFRDEMNKDYPEPILVLFSGQVESACGFGSAASGPFYCPADQKIYIDLSFYNDLRTKFGASGDFSMAYVIAHEVGHHVQNVLGISDQVQDQRRRANQVEGNRLSVRLELQADFLAGVWTHHAHRMKDILEDGDIEEALNAAHAIGDDRMQKRSRGYVVPDAFTHGSSKQRMYWYKKGVQSGKLEDGDTFSNPI